MQKVWYHPVYKPALGTRFSATHWTFERQDLPDIASNRAVFAAEADLIANGWQLGEGAAAIPAMPEWKAYQPIIQRKIA